MSTNANTCLNTAAILLFTMAAFNPCIAQPDDTDIDTSQASSLSISNLDSVDWIHGAPDCETEKMRRLSRVAAGTVRR